MTRFSSLAIACCIAGAAFTGCKDDRPEKCKEIFTKRVETVGKVGKFLGGSGGGALAQLAVSTPGGEAQFMAKCQALPKDVVTCMSMGMANAKGDPTCRKLLKEHKDQLPHL
jgi:hypothetical protein